MIFFKLFILYKWKRKVENIRRCDVCDIDDHRASYAKQLGSNNYLQNKKQNDMIIPDWVLQEQEPIEIIAKKTYTIPKLSYK